MSVEKTLPDEFVMIAHKAFREAKSYVGHNGELYVLILDKERKEILADLYAKTNALERIASIKNQIFGHDWAEIEEAREIARAALKGTP